jgi:hypothetical protein
VTDPIGQLKHELVAAAERQTLAAAAGSGRRWRVPASSHGVRARVVIAAGVAVAAVVAILAATITGGTTDAYAIDSQPDGTVTVQIASLSDAAGLQAALRDRGIPAIVDYSATCTPVPGPPPTSVTRPEAPGPPADEVEQAPEPAPGTSAMDVGARVQVSKDTNGSGGVTFTIDPGSIPAGQNVYITTYSGEMDALSVGVGSKAPTPLCPPAAP